MGRTVDENRAAAPELHPQTARHHGVGHDSREGGTESDTRKAHINVSCRRSARRDRITCAHATHRIGWAATHAQRASTTGCMGGAVPTPGDAQPTPPNRATAAVYGGRTIVIARCTPRRARRSSVGEPEVVTRNRSGSPPASACAARAMSIRRGSDGPPGQVDPVAEAAGQLGHLRTEPADDRPAAADRAAGSRPPRPSAPDHTSRSVADGRLDGAAAERVAGHRAAERHLLGGVRRAARHRRRRHRAAAGRR